MREVENTDKIMWDSEDGMSTVFVTKEGEGIGISVAGKTRVTKAKDWMEHMEEFDRFRYALGEARARISRLEACISDITMEKYKK